MEKLNFSVPIQESVKVNSNPMLIKGLAITETTTRNNVTYVAEELEKSAHTFRNKPVLLDHQNSVRAIVGRTTEKVSYDKIKKGIMFEAKIMDREIQQMIKDGRITNVSIGAMISELSEENGKIYAKGITGLEISLVAVPGDENASVSSFFEVVERFMLNKKRIEEREKSDKIIKEIALKNKIKKEAEEFVKKAWKEGEKMAMEKMKAEKEIINKSEEKLILKFIK